MGAAAGWIQRRHADAAVLAFVRDHEIAGGDSEWREAVKGSAHDAI
jgi:hypothetical protein